ncbi:lantibiotic dehydratase [Streptomyces radicis]|uniref:Lantibiotic dehydratase n=1 Tax=Streptomyces radicis TaxID=1750517 RepID=A0A3A9WLV9_9ACTN|nr:lantibiotic dehydratase [Streptomyces radicis]RKN10454.1 lantibiotic dehydratase [Streptomyces radicis]RKN24713.1 lantibiotic dehydratase [Streptomyces radicis]
MVQSVFVHHPVAMARIPLRPAEPGQAENTAGLLAEGVFLASRSTSQAADASPAGARLMATWRAYDIRSRTRTTPHGVFSGVAPAAFCGHVTTLRLGDQHRAVTTPSPEWLAAVTDRLLDDEKLLPRLTLTANNLVVRRGDRLEAEHPALNGGVAQRSSIRATPVSLWMLETCRRGMPGKEVLAGLAERHPAAGTARIADAARQMIRTGFLHTDLLPAHLRDDPLGHLLERLPESAPLRSALAFLRDVLIRADALRPGAPQRLELLRSARRAADEIVAVERSLTADTLADATLAVPHTIGAQAARAASLLWRIGQLGTPLADYHERFVRAYGHHRMVPLLDVIDPVTGIGPPDDTDDIGARRDLDPRRAELLTRLHAEATVRGQAEIDLDDDLVQRLAHSDGASPPRTAEIHIRLLRHGGDLRVAVCDMGSQDAGSAAGRFARWLPRLAPPTTGPDGPIVAEIVCRPQSGPPAALTVETGFASHRIPLGVPERDGDLAPDDLMVTTTGQHLAIWSARHQRVVVPVLFSRIARDLLPPAAHLLRLTGHSGTRPWHPWSWGSAAHAPFTPRVRYKNVLLAPARWRLPEELATAASRRPAWDKALTTWHTAATPPPPDLVVVQESDRHLPLDLRRNEDRELLRRSVCRGARTVAEPFGGIVADDAIIEGPGGRHVAELVVGLSRRDHSFAPHPDARATPRRPGTVHLPGGPWLSAALPVAAPHQDTVLRQLPAVLAPAAGHIRRLFWLRYHTSALGDHLRIRVHGDPRALTARVLPLLTDWCTALADQRLASGLVLEPYEPETERYGGPRAIGAAEEVFAADSAFAAWCLALTASMDDRLVVAAVSAADIVRTLTDQAHQALRGAALPTPDRRTRDAIRPRLRARCASLIPEPLTDAWNARHEGLITFGSALRGPGLSALCASDFVHMHCNRLIGPDPGRERVARSLASDFLHVHGHRR